MMISKYIKLALICFACISALAYLACERDDLCPDSTQTTASLIITAFDASNLEDRKNIADLRIIGVNNDKVLEGFNIVTEDSLVLPLRTDADVTQYVLHQNYAENDNATPDNPDDDFIEGNADTITVRYVRNEIYVSRACGFKTLFTNVSVVREDDGDNWISFLRAENANQTIEDEAQAHFKLFH